MNERIYRQFLKCYPASFRAEYGKAMLQHFRDQLRDAHSSRAPFAMTRLWIATVCDTLVASFRERFSKTRRQKGSPVANTSKRLPSIPFLFIAFFLPLMTAVVLNLLTQPRTFSSISRIEVYPKGGEKVGFDPYLMQTQMELIKSEALLRNVIAELGLARSMAETFGLKTDFSRSDAVETLRREIQVSQNRNTSLLEIRVNSHSSSVATAIANAIPAHFASFNPRAEVRVIDYARESIRPIRPNVPLTLIAGTFLSAVLSLAASFLLRFILRRTISVGGHASAA